MALFGALVLVLFVLLRPMELWPEIAQLHSLEVLTAITALGVTSEALSRERTAGPSPQLAWLAAFLACSYAVSIARLGIDDGWKAAWGMTLGPIFMVLVVRALPQLRRLLAMALLLLACCGFVAAVAVHQGAQPRECIELRELPMTGDERETEPVPDGRECAGAMQCENGGAPESDYICERVGSFGTMSTQGRVRWRGQLDDPNELAVVIGALLPFMLMFGASPSRRIVKVLAVAALLGVGLWAVILTQSRGGQLVLGTAVMAILVRRLRWWSIVVAAALVLPVVLFSWRADADAESSSLERAEILSEGLQLLASHPLVGIGVGQFASENPLNMAAHNSYLLIATELGLPGYLVWCGLVWMTVKIPVVIALRPPPGLDPELVRFAEALAASIIGLLVGIFFLSFVYKHVFFVWLGLAGALYGAVRNAHPDFTIRTTTRDLTGIGVFGAVALVAVRVACMHAR